MIKTIDDKNAYERSLQWIKNQTLDERGIAAQTGQRVCSLEATALLIPTLMRAQEFNLAEQYAEFLSYLQQPNGAYTDRSGHDSILETGMVLSGMVEAAGRWERFQPTVRMACEYLLSRRDERGCFCDHNAQAPKAIHVAILPALRAASRELGESRYQEAAFQSLEFYKSQRSLIQSSLLTRFLASIIEGLMAMEESVLAQTLLEDVMRRQKKDGGISAYPDETWVCSTGLAHLAAIAARLGMQTQARQALDYLLRRQSTSGGFLGSYGLGAKYAPKQEVALTNKFVLDALQAGSTIHTPSENAVQPLDDRQWHRAMADHSVEQLANKLYSHDFPVWIKPLLTHTRPGESVLEMGSGTGELSAILGLYGRRMHLMDYSAESIAFAKTLFARLNLSAEFYRADICREQPLDESAVDWVMSSGVLEHFTDEDIIHILKKSRAMCTRGVMSLFPNANAVFYRIGKLKQEQDKTWLYGRETPKSTLIPLFKAAGLHHIKEYSVGTYHALRFWGSRYPEVAAFLKTLSLQELNELNQGYLLFTYGEKNA